MKRRKREPIEVSIPLGIILVDEIAREIAREISERLPRKLVTRTVDYRNTLVDGELVVVDSKKPGRIHEMVFRSTGKNYVVAVVADATTLLRGSFDELSDVGKYLESVDAFESNGDYVVYIKDLKWDKECKVIVKAQKTLFKNIFCKWDEEVT